MSDGYGCFFADDTRCPECDSRYCPEGDCRKREGRVFIVGRGWTDPDVAERLVAMGYDIA